MGVCGSTQDKSEGGKPQTVTANRKEDENLGIQKQTTEPNRQAANVAQPEDETKPVQNNQQYNQEPQNNQEEQQNAAEPQNNQNPEDMQRRLDFLRYEAQIRHNELRALHQVPELQQANQLNDIAQKYAEHLAATQSFGHSGNDFEGQPMGENIYYSMGDVDEVNGQKIVDSWYSEIKDYDFNTGKSINGEPVGHFTQVVWKGTQYFGLGVAFNGEQCFVVANYYPSGNMIGEEKENVLPATQ